LLLRTPERVVSCEHTEHHPVRVDDAHFRHADAVVDSDLELALRLARIETGATHRHELTVTS
jgi:hypothetical protein